MSSDPAFWKGMGCSAAISAAAVDELAARLADAVTLGVLDREEVALRMVDVLDEDRAEVARSVRSSVDDAVRLVAQNFRDIADVCVARADALRSGMTPGEVLSAIPLPERPDEE